MTTSTRVTPNPRSSARSWEGARECCEGARKGASTRIAFVLDELRAALLADDASDVLPTCARAELLGAFEHAARAAAMAEVAWEGLLAERAP